jgi:hypothetical protein
MFRMICAAFVVVALFGSTWFGPGDQPSRHAGAAGGAPSRSALTAAPPNPPPDQRLALVCLAATIALPIMSMGALRRVVRKHSNHLNARVLALFVTVDLLVAALVFPIGLSFADCLIWAAITALAAISTLGSMMLALRLEG